MSNDNDEYDDLNEAYEQLMRPDEVIKWFDTMDDFREWLETGTVRDLVWALDDFEEYELYEHCAIILAVLERKILTDPGYDPGTII